MWFLCNVTHLYLCVLSTYVSHEISAGGHDSPDGGQPNFTPPKYSEQYCGNSYYDPKAGRSHTMPKLQPTNKQYSVNVTPASKDIPLLATFTPLENFTQWKRISSREVKEAKFE